MSLLLLSGLDALAAQRQDKVALPSHEVQLDRLADVRGLCTRIEETASARC
jgi:hypothetical protein